MAKIESARTKDLLRWKANCETTLAQAALGLNKQSVLDDCRDSLTKIDAELAKRGKLPAKAVSERFHTYSCGCSIPTQETPRHYDHACATCHREACRDKRW